MTANWFRCRPGAERGPDTDIPRGSGCGIVRVARRLHRTMTLTSRWKPREYGNTGSLSLSPLTNHSFPERADATAEGEIKFALDPCFEDECPILCGL